MSNVVFSLQTCSRKKILLHVCVCVFDRVRVCVRTAGYDSSPELMAVLGVLTCAFRCIVFSISRIKELARAQTRAHTHTYGTYTHGGRQGKCMQKHPPTHTDTPGRGRGKSRCVLCVSDAQSESRLIDCASDVSASAASLLQLTYAVFFSCFFYSDLIIDLLLAEKRSV